MKRTAKSRLLSGALCSFLALFCLPLVVHGAAVDVDAAKKEGEVILYGTVPPKTMAAVTDAFEKKYGIKVEYWRAASPKILDRALTEWRAGRPGFDVIEATRGTQLLMRDEGFYAPYRPAGADTLPEKLREKDDLLTPWRATPVSILYNTDMVKSEDAPKTYSELVDPKWKNKISVPDPSRHTTTAQLLSSMHQFFGENSDAWIKKLAAQEPHLVVSLLPVGRAIVSGEAPVGITFIKYVRQVKGPLDYVRMDQYLAEINYYGLSKKAPHPNAAKLFMEYANSPEAMKAIAEQGEFVLTPGVNPAIEGAEQIKESIVLMDVPTAEGFKKLKEKYRKMFYEK